MQREPADIVVVGSSPILMLFALQARRVGQSVSLIEQSDTMGGAWSLDRHKLGNHQIVHENACHLIEWYAGGYQLLESISGVRFVPLDPQPIKVWNNGRVAPYTSRRGIAFEYMLSWRAIAYSLIKLGLGYIGVGKYTKEAGWLGLRYSISRVIMETRYRLPGLTRFDGVRGPEGGFAHFVQHLTDELRREGVSIIQGQATGMIVYKGMANLSVAGTDVKAGRVVVGESSVLAGAGIVESEGFHFSDYHHVLVSLPAADTLERNSYVHYPDHQIFHRITYVEDTIDEDGVPVAIFLLQLRQPLAEIADLRLAFAQALTLYAIAGSSVHFRILKSIDARHLSSGADSAWRSFDGNAPLVLKTIGDLSRNALVVRQALAGGS